MCFFGDGAVNEGAFHESLNLASLWNLPVLFVCENNLYGMGTPVERACRHAPFYRRAQCYALEVESVDGMDVLAVIETAETCIKRVRETRRPIFVEAATYRYRGHSVADPGTYRSHEEIEEWRRRDPILKFGSLLLREGTLTHEEIDRIRDSVGREIEKAVQFAEDSPLPDIEALHRDVYS